MKFTLFIVRHGETYLNKHDRMQGWSDSPLTLESIEIIEKYRELFLNLKPKLFITSDLGRSIETAERIVGSEQIKIKSFKEFRETFFGGLESEDNSKVWRDILNLTGYSSISELREKTKMIDIANYFNKIDPDRRAETSADIENRILSSYNLLQDILFDGDKVMLILHGAFIRHFIYKFSKVNIGNINNLDCFKCDFDTSNSLPLTQIEKLNLF